MSNQTLPHETIAKMVQQINQPWEIQEVAPADEGRHIVYHLDIETETGRRNCTLKATPPAQSPTCGDEARLLAFLGGHTSLPVPEVFGVVDEHEHLPTPFFLASTLPGTNYNPSTLADFSETAIRQLAYSTGRYLAMLHDLDAVDAYGLIDIETAELLDGGRPSPDVEQIVVQDPKQSWTDYLTAEVDRIVTILETTRFGDLTSTIRPVLEAQIESLSGEFEPVITRIDQSLDNVLVDPETNAVTGLIDWGFSVAATPAYDLAFVERDLVGGYWGFVTEIPQSQKMIRSAMLDGYREVGTSRIVEQFHENHECYTLLSNLHLLLNFDAWFDQADATADQRETAVDPLRTQVENFC